MNNKPMYKRAEIVWIEFGDLLKDISYNEYLSRNDIAKRYGIKMNREFAYYHMGLILTPVKYHQFFLRKRILKDVINNFYEFLNPIRGKR